MYYVFETFRWATLKETEDYEGLSIEEAFITWGSDYKQWLIRARLYHPGNISVNCICIAETCSAAKANFSNPVI